MSLPPGLARRLHPRRWQPDSYEWGNVRRPCQVRLVKASHKSVNSGDAYILISNDRPSKCEIYVWLGKFVNAIERSRASEVAQAIVQQKDLGCKATKVQTIEEEKSTVNAGPNKRFWQLLGCENTPLKVNIFSKLSFEIA